jgi:crotonobetainyl-CoA:carnitine CoA-transferase CaiB-like acyl-CoA transferase
MSEALPLSGIVVLDLTLARAGPTCVRHLADWGADVIRVEPPDPQGEDVIGRRHGADFQNLHRNKRTMQLDLKSEQGYAVFLRLVERADVLVENMRAPVKDRLRISWNHVKKVNPRLVYGSISGFGQTGPYRERGGVDQIAQGLAGLMSVTGLPGQGPVRVGIPIADLCAGIFCAHGIMVALVEREKSGKGQWVKSSLLQAQLFMLDFQAARWLMRGEVAKQAGNNHPTSIPTGVYKTRDGYLNLAVSGTKIWTRLCEAIGAPKLATHPDFSNSKLRSQNRDKLHGELETYFAKRDTAAWIEILNKAGVPSGPINTIDQAFADPQAKSLGMVQKVGDVPYLGQPVTLSRTPSHAYAHPPKQGEHTPEILNEIGYTAAAVEDLRKKGVV